MNQLISDFIKGKLSKRKREHSRADDKDSEVKDVEPNLPGLFPNSIGVASHNSDTHDTLNDIQEEEVLAAAPKDKVEVSKRENKKSTPGSIGRKPSLPGLRRLKHRVSSLPDLRLKSLSHRNKHTTDQNEDANWGGNIERGPKAPSLSTPSLRFTLQNNDKSSSGSTLSTNAGTISSGKKSARIRSWLHLTPAPKTDEESKRQDEDHRAILKQKVQIKKVVSLSDAASIYSGPRSASVSRSVSRSRSSKSTSRMQSGEILGLTTVSRSKSSEVVNNRVGSLRRSNSSLVYSVRRSTLGGQHSREASMDSADESGISMINFRRRRSRTIGTLEQHHSDSISNKGSVIINANNGPILKERSIRGRSNSSSSNFIPTSTTNPNQRNFSSLNSRRSNSLVTTLTNIMSLRSVTGLHAQRFPLPVPVLFESLDKPSKPLETDTIDDFLSKTVPVYQKYLALVLCAHEDDFLLSCLQKYMDTEFDFSDQPLDLSLRTVLLFLELPKESQQIERFLKCFSISYLKQSHKRFMDSNGIEPMWKDIEQLHFLAYSLLVLHTDTFNPNNKDKITKVEFVRLIHSDTESSGKSVPREYLEYLYDNITAKEFPVVILPPYEVEENFHLQDKVVNMVPESYSPAVILKSQWLAQRCFLILGNKSTLPHQYPLTPPALPTGVMSSASSSMSLFAIEDIDPYYYLINDSLANIKLQNFIDSVPSESLVSAQDVDAQGAKKLLSLLKEIKGGYLKFNKTQILSKFPDINFEIMNKNSELRTGFLKVLKMGEIDMKVNTRKFSLVGNVVRSHWKTKFAILTTSFLFFFDSMTSLEPQLVMDELTKTSNYIIDLSQSLSEPYEMEYCNRLFLTENKDEGPNVLSIVNQNQKRDIMFRDAIEAATWKNSIYFSGSIDGCQMEIGGLKNTLIVERRTSLQDKILKLKSNHEQNMSKWSSLHAQLNLYLNTAPITTKTRSTLIDHINGITKRIEMVSYQNERLDIYIKLLNLIAGLEPSLSEYNSFDVSSIEESFLFSQQSRKSFEQKSVSETD
ncbi:unnamed protein product [Kluyveromyces dobzhanskii CBS 2104]|uniref:WGS project CCBQ000000000 data, contig 00097 n=1 Tax=Kluyveromyces dobzhanskii CBS 2104 TaxID=1427455 RepID=A0A0A8L571_9SACH|nr:unnamed protein product [Kluyveromyces dobzhanskii CBS 2104]